MLRKQVLRPDSETKSPKTSASTMSVADIASVQVSSEDPSYPIDHAFDNRSGPGGTRWVAAETGEQTIILAFDQPQRVQKVGLEIEEPENMTHLRLTIKPDKGGRPSRATVTSLTLQ